MAERTGKGGGDLDATLALMGLDGNALATLRGARSMLAEAIGPAVASLHDALAARSPDKAEGAPERLTAHWLGLIESGITEGFLARARERGEGATGTGIAPEHGVAAHAHVLGILVERLIATRGAERRGWRAARTADADRARRAAEAGALVRAGLLDLEIAVTVHLEELERRRQALEVERAKREEAQNRMANALGRVLTAIGEGDLTVRLGRDLPYGFLSMAESFDAALDSLAEAMGRVHGTSGGLTRSVERIVSDTEKLAVRTESQASSLEQSAAALHELTTSVATAADGAGQAAEAIRLLTERARTSAAAAERASGAVQAIESSSAQIARITQVIDGLAFQTNLLSLNASIEAARAGEAGRGFAVVALEVRRLAQRCGDAAHDIHALLSESGSHVAAGVGLIAEMGAALRDIAQQVGGVSRTVDEIALGAREQAQGLKEINDVVAQLDVITQQNTAMVDQNRAQSAALREAAQGLARDVGAFRTRPAAPEAERGASAA